MGAAPASAAETAAAVASASSRSPADSPQTSASSASPGAACEASRRITSTSDLSTTLGASNAGGAQPKTASIASVLSTLVHNLPTGPVGTDDEGRTLECEEFQQLLHRVCELEQERGSLERRLQRAAIIESNLQAVSEENEELRSSFTATQRREQALDSEASALRGQVQSLTKAVQDLVRPLSRSGYKSRLDAERFASGRSCGSNRSSNCSSPTRASHAGAGEEQERQEEQEDDRDLVIVNLIKERDVLRARLQNLEAFSLVNGNQNDGERSRKDADTFQSGDSRRELDRYKQENSALMKQVVSLQEEAGTLRVDKMKLVGDLRQANARVGGLDFLEKEHEMLSKISVLMEKNSSKLLAPTDPARAARVKNLRATFSEGHAPSRAMVRHPNLEPSSALRSFPIPEADESGSAMIRRCSAIV